MKTKKSLIVSGLCVFLMISVAHAHEWTGYRGTEGWGLGHPYQNLYNPKGIEVYSGEVIDVDTVIPMKGMSSGVHLLLLTKDKKTISVHLGPAWFIERLDTQVKKGNQIEVTGSMVIMNIEKKPGEFSAEHVLIAS
ncbi:MAG: DNA-binding protein [Nitrospirota bacterium]